jgi:hypothetical protein
MDIRLFLLSHLIYAIHKQPYSLHPKLILVLELCGVCATLV